MMGPSAFLTRPSDLEMLEAQLAQLALGDALLLETSVKSWLESIAVVRPCEADTVIADEDWLACALPSSSEEELLTRTLLRDPLYRLHVDIFLAEVVVAVGQSGRWPRLEELIFGELSILAPRIAAMIEFARSGYGGWETVSWRNLDVLPKETSSLMDQRCWGISGAPDELFPILRIRYPALASVPVFLPMSSPLAARVVSAATRGEGIRISGQRKAEVIDLAWQGAPLWWYSHNDQLEVSLGAPCRTRGLAEDLTSHMFSRGIPAHVRERSALVPDHCAAIRASFWKIADTKVDGLAFVGAQSRKAWPEDKDAAGRGLPCREQLEHLVRSRQPLHGTSDPADDALQLLAEHPLYGFWIQILLLEALDRELGEETLIFAPPTHALVEDVEAETRIFYRPRNDSSVQAQLLYELGSLDDIMTKIAKSVQVHPVPTLGDAGGTWAMSLALLARVGVVQTRHDRWTLSTHVLDRLHGGGLMTGVIRRGRTFREHVHNGLEQLWQTRHEAAQEDHNA